MIVARVPSDWKGVYKGEGEKKECANYKGISFLSILGKMYRAVLGGAGGCVGQVYSLNAEKYLKIKNLKE